MRLSTKEQIKDALTRDAIFEWLETEQNDADWAVEHLICDILLGDDETKEEFYEFIRETFIRVMVADMSLEQLPFAGLSTLRVTPGELAKYYPMDDEALAYVRAELVDDQPLPRKFVYKASGKKALVAGLMTGIALGLAAAVVITRLRK